MVLGEKGVRGPSRGAARKNAPEPRGATVLPGDYKAVLHFGGVKDSTTISVAYDPRIEMPMSTLKGKYDLLKKLEKKTALAGKAIQQLLASKKIAESYKKQLKEQKGDDYKAAIKATDSIVKSINTLVDDMLGKVDRRQGITSNPKPTPISYLYGARSYVGSLQQPAGKTEKDLIKNADKKVGTEIAKIKAFYAKDWPAYRKKVEGLKFNLFKDYEELKE